MLGYIVSSRGISTDPEKIQSIVNYTRPKNKKDIQSFLGLAGYYQRFIELYCIKVYPLTKLLKNKIEFFWNDKCEQSFIDIKSYLQKASILKFPKINEDYKIFTDVSLLGIGAVLVQDFDDFSHPVYFASKKLNETESRYPIYELEVMAILFAFKKFHKYIYDRNVTLYADSQAVKYLLKNKSNSNKIWRWIMYIQQYNFTIAHIKDSQNFIPDGLSRYGFYNNSDEIFLNDVVDILIEYDKNY